MINNYLNFIITSSYILCFLYLVLGSKDIANIPSSQVTQYLISAMQACEKYNSTSNYQIHTNLISGYPRHLEDIKDFMKKVKFK